MADEATNSAPTPIIQDPGAPFITFNAVPSFCHIDGMFGLVLTLPRPVSLSNGQVPLVPVAVAQLHADRNAMLALRNAIDDAFLLAVDAQGQKN
jgi:hypothetical protein